MSKDKIGSNVQGLSTSNPEAADEIQQALQNFPVESESKDARTIQIRYILAAMGFWCFFVLAAMRVNLSIGIVAMVNWKAIKKDMVPLNETQNECHYPGNVTREKTMEGPFIWDPNTQGHILSCYFYGLASTQLAGGRIAELVSAKYVLLVGTAVATLANCLIPVVADNKGYGVMALQVFKGFGQGIVMPAFSVLMGKWVPPSERARFMALIASGLPVGSFFTIVISGIICKTNALGWTFVFYIFGIVAVIWCVLWTILIYESPLTHPYISKEELDKIMTLRTQKAPILYARVPFNSILTSLAVWAYVAAGFASWWVLCLYITVIPMFLGTVLKLDIETNGLMAAFPAMSEAFVLLAASVISDQLLNKNVFTATTIRKGGIGIGLIGFALSILVVTWTSCHRILTVMFLVLALGMSGFSFASTTVVPVDMAPRFAGTISGIMNTVGALSGVIIPTIVGYLTKDAQTMQEWSEVFYLSALICFLGAVIFIFFGSSQQQKWADSSTLGSQEQSSQEPFGRIELVEESSEESIGKPPPSPTDTEDNTFEEDDKEKHWRDNNKVKQKSETGHEKTAKTPGEEWSEISL